MPRKNIVIFDLDNTLIDIDQRFFMILRKNILFLRQQTGKDFRRKAEILLHQSPGLSMEEVCQKILPTDSARRAMLIRQCVEQYYAAALSKQVKMLPGVRSVLRFLRRQGALIFLVTYGNPTVQEQKIDQIGREWFDHIYITQEKKEKIFRSILSTTHAGKDTSFVIGDKQQDEMTIGNLLGLQTIHFCYGRHAQQKSIEKPLYTVYNMRELLTLFKTLLCSKTDSK